MRQVSVTIASVENFLPLPVADYLLVVGKLSIRIPNIIRGEPSREHQVVIPQKERDFKQPILVFPVRLRGNSVGVNYKHGNQKVAVRSHIRQNGIIILTWILLLLLYVKMCVRCIVQ